MMLNPLAEVGIGMFVPIVVSRRQLVMDILRHGKGRNGEQQKRPGRSPQCREETQWQMLYGSAQSH